MSEGRPKVAYLTTFYNGEIDGRLGRFHDWVHQLRDMENPPFKFEVHTFTATNPDETLVSQPYELLGDGDDLWGTRLNKPEFLLNAPRIRRDLRQSDFDVLHALQLDTISFPTGAFARSEPVVVGPDILGWNPARSGGKWDVPFPRSLFSRSKFGVKQLLAASKQYDLAVAYSAYHRSILRALGIPGDKVSLIPPGVDPIFHPEGWAPIGDPPNMLYVGDLSNHKGFPTVVEALQSLDQDVHLTVVGAGETKEADTSGLNVQVEGFVPRRDLPRYYRDADLFVMPSIDEAGPNTLVESLACGTPVVATNKPGINEYTPNGAGIHFWPRDPSSLADAIKRAIESLPELKQMARNHADDFHIDKTVQGLNRLYRSLLSGY